ncbi:MAG: LCP family protein [Chitinispirillaceae bacterium]|nr:LCP family protein [Chitinispirillaceae bacterium]
MKRLFSIFTACIYLILIGASLWQGFLLLRQLQPRYGGTDIAMIDVMVEGNVRRPGRYRVAQGTTQFEILQVAGVRPTSDLSMLSLTAQIDSSGELTVGTLDKAVGMSEESLSVRLEFFFGELSVISVDGRSVPQHERLTISPGDRILTEASSQAELSAGLYSRIDMDNFAELVFDKIGVAENERILTELYQKAGACWHKIVYARNSELFRINTIPVAISVGGSGADFLVDAQSDRITINLMDGLLLVERTGGGEAINMISGQSATIFTDERPFQITKLTPDISINEQFAQLSREKVNYLSRQMPLSILFCGTPAVFYFINVYYDRASYTVVHLPGELLIEQFANGISTLDQAFLYGGPVMVATFVERILDTRIPKYIVFDKNDIVKVAGAMGGLQADVDRGAASYLQRAAGKQKLSDQALVRYLSPSISGIEDARRRQSEMLKTLFNGLQSRSLIPTLMLADQIIGSTETNFGATEIMDNYGKFCEKTNWHYRELTIPAAAERRGNRNCLNPKLDQCKILLNAYE